MSKIYKPSDPIESVLPENPIGKIVEIAALGPYYYLLKQNDDNNK